MLMCVAFGIIASFVLSGCSKTPGIAVSAQWDDACGECHAGMLQAQATGGHALVGCDMCHAGASTDGHAENPEGVEVAIDWTIDACSPCHADEARTYLYDDNLQVGPFGGSQRVPVQPKSDAFPQYKDVVAGHAFAKEYNEEGAHAFMLEDHYETTRGKFETCVQCKSTKVAYAWSTGMPITTSDDVRVTLTHTKTETQTAQVVTVPKGTEVTWSSTEDDHLTRARAQFPDGTVYTSYESTDTADGGTKDFNMMWAATIAATSDTMPYGAGCNHCHDPHSAKPRIVREALSRAIADKGVNPYAENSPTSFDEARGVDKGTVICAQCHVEYVCGKSGVDGIDRDYFSWSKAGDLHDLYGATFGYQQDWIQQTIGEPLIKNQHPEAELNWNSPHYAAGVSCVDCHMPRVISGNGTPFKSHWFTSPYKYQDAAVYARFATATGLQGGELPTPCSLCHEDRTQRGIGQQKRVFERQGVVQARLAESSTLLGTITSAEKPLTTAEKATYERALEAHRKAHALWENLIVSENSMGFHNYGEVMDAMADAEKLAGEAISAAKTLSSR